MIEIILGLVFVFFLVCSSVTKPREFPPGPFRMPFLGYAAWIDQRLPYRTWNKLRKRYGEIVGLYLGTQRAVIVNGWEAIKEGLHNDDLNDRPDNFYIRDTNKDGKLIGLMFVNHDYWKVQRRFSLFHLRNLGFGKKSHETVIHEELYDVIQEFKDHKLEPFSVQNPLGLSGTNILWAIVGGERFSRNDKKLQTLVTLIAKAFRAGKATGGLLGAFPALRHVFPDLSGYRTVIEGFRGSMAFIQTYISEHRASFDPENPRDFIDVFLNELQKENKDESFTDVQLAGVCLNLFLAGTEAGSSLGTFAILFLCLFPEEQRKLHDEIDKIVGRDRLPSVDDRIKLVKVDAFLQEVTRMRCPAPHTLRHWARVDTTLQGYRIPKDTLVQFNLRSVLMDEDYWGDPEEFRPERFVENGTIKKYERMIPFGKDKGENGLFHGSSRRKGPPRLSELRKGDAVSLSLHLIQRCREVLRNICVINPQKI